MGQFGRVTKLQVKLTAFALNELNGSIPAAFLNRPIIDTFAHNKLSGSIPAAASALEIGKLTVEGT